MKKLLKRLKKTGEESVKDPEIIAAVATPTITKTGLLVKILYIFGQVVNNFKKHK
jgi:hypothetical protein